MVRALAISFVALAILVVACHKTPAPPVGWLPTFDAAVRQAQSKKTLVMVDFYADW